MHLKSKNIEAVFKVGKRFKGSTVILSVVTYEDTTTPTQFIYSVTRTIKKKPMKNTLKRRMKEIIRLTHSIANGYYIAIIAYKANASYQHLKDDIHTLLTEKVQCMRVGLENKVENNG